MILQLIQLCRFAIVVVSITSCVLAPRLLPLQCSWDKCVIMCFNKSIEIVLAGNEKEVCFFFKLVTNCGCGFVCIAILKVKINKFIYKLAIPNRTSVL